MVNFKFSLIFSVEPLSANIILFFFVSATAQKDLIHSAQAEISRE